MSATVHRGDAENTEEAQREMINSLRNLCDLCASAVKFSVAFMREPL